MEKKLRIEWSWDVRDGVCGPAVTYGYKSLMIQDRYVVRRSC